MILFNKKKKKHVCLVASCCSLYVKRKCRANVVGMVNISHLRLFKSISVHKCLWRIPDIHATNLEVVDICRIFVGFA